MVCAILFDPRYKDGELLPSFLKRVVDGRSVVKDDAWYHVEEMADRVNSECLGACTEDTVLSPVKRKGLLSMAEDCCEGNHQEYIAVSDQQGYTRMQVRAAISYYKSLAQTSEDADPLAFWKENDKSGSLLAPLIEAAAEVLAIPATEAICERIFRRAGEVLTKYRMSLLGSNFESILMANYNAPKWQGVKGVNIPVLKETDVPPPTSSSLHGPWASQ